MTTLVSARSAAQTASTAVPNAARSEVLVTAGVEWHRDRFYYQFENPSSIDTPFPVPHNFRQTYVGDAAWLAGSVRYPFFGDHMETEIGVAPTIRTTASDIDTFYDPGGDVVVSGTVGDVDLRSWRVAQWAETRAAGLLWRVGYRYRRDASDFMPADVIVTHSNPPSQSRRPTTDREHTLSEVHEVPVGVEQRLSIAPRWMLVAGATGAPITRARLTTILPDKYPGREIVFEARVVAAQARVELLRQSDRWPIVMALQYGRTWSYQSTAQFHRDAIQASVRVGLAPR